MTLSNILKFLKICVPLSRHCTSFLVCLVVLLSNFLSLIFRAALIDAKRALVLKADWNKVCKTLY